MIRNRLSNIFPFSIESFARGHKPFEKAKTIVQYLYYFLAFQSIVVLHGGGSMRGGDFSPVWSIAWAEFLSFADTDIIIRIFFLASAFIGAFFYRHRVARIIVFLGVFQLHALLSSYLRIDHHWYPWLYVSFLLIFLPDVWTKKDVLLEARKKFLLVFFSAQVAILFMYSMAGLGKILGAYHQFVQDQVHALAPEALALHIAYWLRATDSTSLLGPFFVKHLYAGWPLFVGVIYLQFFSLWAAFKPSLHRIWAFGLIMTHLGIYATMSMLYFPTSLFLLFLFFDSPFRKQGATFRETILDLPLFGWLLRRLWPRSK